MFLLKEDSLLTLLIEADDQSNDSSLGDVKLILWYK